jgi:hypothetical protein
MTAASPAPDDEVTLLKWLIALSLIPKDATPAQRRKIRRMRAQIEQRLRAKTVVE